MANLTDVQLYSALCSDVYHHNDDDQWIDLPDIQKDLKPVGDLANQVPNFYQLGFTAADDGFYYKPNGFGARVVLDEISNKYIIVYRGTDFNDLTNTGVPGQVVKALTFGRSRQTGTGAGTDQNDIGDIVADIQTGKGEWYADDQAHDAIKFAEAVQQLAGTKKVVVTGQSLGGGLAGLVCAKLGLESWVFDPAPFAKYLTSMASEAAAISTLGDLSISKKEFLFSKDRAGQIDFLNNTVFNDPAQTTAYIAKLDSELAALKAKITQHQKAFRITGELLDPNGGLLNANSTLGKVISFVGNHFDGTINSIDVGAASHVLASITEENTEENTGTVY
jgi:hypothetical protein